jgi:hypothetical protein
MALSAFGLSAYQVTCIFTFSLVILLKVNISHQDYMPSVVLWMRYLEIIRNEGNT